MNRQIIRGYKTPKKTKFKMKRYKGRVWGFALIEVPVIATFAGNTVAGESWGASLAPARVAVLNQLKQVKNIGPITGPLNPGITWPNQTNIVRVEHITRLFGLSAARMFHIFVEIDAPGPNELVQAFHYLEHYCGVEGYGGG